MSTTKRIKAFVAPAVMYTSEEYCTYLKSIKDDKEKILSHLWAIHSEIHKNQKSSVLLENLIEKEFKKHLMVKDEMKC